MNKSISKLVKISLGILLAFVSINALGGGFYGLMGAKGVPLEWLQGSPFTSYFIPSLILLVVIGGSFLFSTIAVFACFSFARIVSLASAIILAGWICIQVAIIGYVSWMQPFMGITALIVFILAFLHKKNV